MIRRSFGTHDGTFHADEVTACALLLVFDLIDRDKIIRTRDPKELAECDFVCDVDGVYDSDKRRFDHHQLEYEGELASAGMVWRYLLDQGLIDQNLYDFGNVRVIKGIDAHDNGKILQEEGVCTFSHIIANLVPIEYDAGEEEKNQAFEEALAFAVGHFGRMLERYHYIHNCKDEVAKVMEGSPEALIFDKAIPWQDNFFELGGETHPARFVVMPSSGHWKLRGIPPTPKNRMEVRQPLPESWSGLRDSALEEVSGIKGAIFCHKGQFISVWETKEAALQALETVLKGKKG